MFQLFAIWREGFCRTAPVRPPTPIRRAGSRTTIIDSFIWLGSTWGGCVFLTSWTNARAWNSYRWEWQRSRASPPAFCLIHVPPPRCNIKPVYRAILDWPALPPSPLQSKRLGFCPASACETLTALLYASAWRWAKLNPTMKPSTCSTTLNLHHPACILIQESGIALSFLSFSQSNVTLSNKDIRWSRQKC